MKCLVVSDSFKGTLTSKRIGEIAKEELAKLDIETDYIPVSDGGEGFVESISNLLNIEPIVLPSIGALNDEETARFIYQNAAETAYIEMAEVCGLAKLKGRKDAYLASSYGLGLYTKQVIEKYNPKSVVISLGGTASIDLGIGFLEGLGVKFFDEEGDQVHFIGNGKLPLIKKIDSSALEVYKHIKFTIVNDVKITIFGPEGTIEKYGKQKCAEGQEVDKLVENATEFFLVLQKHTKVPDHAGAGAAGGVAYAINAFLGGEEVNGTELIFNLIKLKEIAPSYDFIITGEGRFDSQTFQGKVVSGVLEASKKVVIICGGKEDDVDYPNSFAIVPNICSLEESLKNPEFYLRKLLVSIPWNKLIF